VWVRRDPDTGRVWDTRTAQQMTRAIEYGRFPAPLGTQLVRANTLRIDVKLPDGTLDGAPFLWEASGTDQLDGVLAMCKTIMADDTPDDQRLRFAYYLADNVGKLDKYLNSGGDLPTQWRHGRLIDVSRDNVLAVQWVNEHGHDTRLEIVKGTMDLRLVTKLNSGDWITDDLADFPARLSGLTGPVDSFEELCRVARVWIHGQPTA
jgi:hypothetical protein